MGKSTPSPPDPFETAQAQSGANKEAIQESAKVSAVDQFAPWGSSTFGRDEAGVPTKQTIALGPAEQQFYDQSNSIKNALAGKAGGFLDYLPNEQFTGPDQGAGDAVSKALYDRNLARINPQLEEARKGIELNLSERGIPIGSEIQQNEMNRFDRTRNDALTGLAQDATLAGGQEYDRQLANALTIRAQPFNEISAFLQGAPAMNQPQFQGTPAFQQAAPDIAGLINSNYQNQLAASNSRNSALSSGLFGLGSAAIGLSDRRMKMNVRRIGQLDNGLPVYGFRYIDGIGPYQIGVMAQEVEDIVPEAVIKIGKDKIRMVNYEKLAKAIRPETTEIEVA
jgi:hypothetical protein